MHTPFATPTLFVMRSTTARAPARRAGRSASRALLLALILAGCDESDADSDDAENTSAATDETDTGGGETGGEAVVPPACEVEGATAADCIDAFAAMCEGFADEASCDAMLDSVAAPVLPEGTSLGCYFPSVKVIPANATSCGEETVEPKCLGWKYDGNSMGPGCGAGPVTCDGSTPSHTFWAGRVENQELWVVENTCGGWPLGFSDCPYDSPSPECSCLCG